jgi:Phage tail lysozyme
MPINRDNFAQICVDQALLFGVNPHYLVAVAELLSGINDDTVGDRIGCFRRTQTEWNAKGSAPEFLVALQADDINITRMQCTFAALQTFRAQDTFLKSHKGKYPGPDELYSLWPADALPAGKTLGDALNTTNDLIDPAENIVLAGLDLGSLVGDIKLDSISTAKRPVAVQIINGFKGAGYGTIQQAAALANAIAESGLNTKSRNFSPPKEDSVGLFQLNRIGGLGKENTVKELQDPATNIALIIKEVNTLPSFKASNSLADAVSIFVHDVEKPADKTGETTKRLSIALKLLPPSGGGQYQPSKRLIDGDPIALCD